MTVTSTEYISDAYVAIAVFNSTVKIALNSTKDGKCGIVEKYSGKSVEEVFDRHVDLGFEDRVQEGGYRLLAMIGIENVVSDGNAVQLKLIAPNDTSRGILVCLWSQRIIVRSQVNNSIYYHEDFINFKNVTVIGVIGNESQNKASDAFKKATEAASYGSVAATVVLFSMSPSACFSLVRLFQNLDIYGYINCKTSNQLTVVLDTLTGDPLDLINNPLSFAVKEAEGVVPYNLAKYGVQTHVLNNYGRQLLLGGVLILIRCIIATMLKLLKTKFKKKFIKKALEYTRIQLWADLFDTYIIDYVLSLTIFFSLRPKPLSKYDTIYGIVFSLLGLGYIGYCILGFVKIAQIKKKLIVSGEMNYAIIKRASPNFGFLLEDVRLDSGLAPYIGMIQVSKESANAFLVYAMYDYPTSFVAVKLSLQVIFVGIVVLIRPSREKWNNVHQIYQHIIFALIDAFFLLICVFGGDFSEDSYNLRYGFPTIALIFLLILGKLILGLGSVLRQYCRKKVIVAPRTAITITKDTKCKPDTNSNIIKRSVKDSIKIKLGTPSALTKAREKLIRKNKDYKVSAVDSKETLSKLSPFRNLDASKSSIDLPNLDPPLRTFDSKLKRQPNMKITMNGTKIHLTGSQKKITTTVSSKKIQVPVRAVRKIRSITNMLRPTQSDAAHTIKIASRQQ